MECKNCKKTIPTDSKFCVQCGEKVDSEKESIKKEGKENKDVPKIILDIRNHLEFMGYELEENKIENDGLIRIIAINKNRPNLIVSYFSSVNILLFVANYTIPKVDSESKKLKLLEVANQINGTKAIISTFNIGSDFNNISISSWYPDFYSKKEFSNFLEYFQNEIMRLINYEALQEFV